MPRLALVSYLVRDYDEAIAYFKDQLGFEVREDAPQGAGKRWVRVGPPRGGADLLLARAATPEQNSSVGRQHGGRVGFFLHTDDFERDYRRMRAAGVRFEGTPRHETYGTVIVFTDLYGNRWDLVEPVDERPRPHHD
jgi:catechol 2,3-dioxygenase-like lactoylglutathione lyase family enzyme